MEFASLRTANGLEQLNDHLKTRSYIQANSVSQADLARFQEVKTHPDSATYPHVSRWYSHVSYLRQHCPTVFAQPKTHQPKTKTADKANLDNVLKNAEMGKVCTRFPPEPSGYLHIGHAKAAMLNHSYARMYEGTFLLRFDDTNPSKEKMEFEESIVSDLMRLGIKPDKVSHTSDYFLQLQEEMEKLIKCGDAYVDDLAMEEMQYQRGEGIESKRRGATVEDNLQLWAQMLAGSERGLKCCVRAKMNMKNPNKCLRDPVFYRCKVDIPHHRTGTKFKAYPTYDFCCPIVDAWEGVTHALRTIEYKDREAMYHWVLEHCNMRKVYMVEFSKMQFSYTVLSKRKLTWFVDNGHVEGWDDPRFPTVRGILRRGLSVEALLEFVMTQGASKNNNLMEWDKIWAVNKQKIDPIVPRYAAVGAEDAVEFHLDGPDSPYSTMHKRHAKNDELGEREVYYANTIYLEQDDAVQIKEGEQITLMRWGNAYVDKIERKGEKVVKCTGRLNLSGSVKDTSKKLHWLPKIPQTRSVVLRELGHLVTKPKMEENDKIEDLINPHSIQDTVAYGDGCLQSLEKGTTIQLERRGYFIVDLVPKANEKMILIRIPDGKSKVMSTVKAKVDPKTLQGRSFPCAHDTHF